MRALILAAGYAARLQPLTTNTPKPLLPVGGRSIIDRILDKVADIPSINAVYVVSNHKFIAKFEIWLESAPLKEKISLIDDGSMSNETRLGAIRDLYLCIKEKSINDDLLVIAGDNLFDFELSAFLNFAARHKDGVSIAVHDVAAPEAAKQYGVVAVDKDDRVTEFEEKPSNPKSTLISTGIYYFPKEKIRDDIVKYAESEGAKLDAPGYYIKWLSVNGRVYGFSFSENWYDIGDIASYEKADKEYSKKGE